MKPIPGTITEVKPELLWKNSQLYSFYIGRETPSGNRFDHKYVVELCDKHFNAYTIMNGGGGWENQHEPMSLVMVDGINDKKAREFAEECKRALSQDAVLVMRQPMLGAIV